MASEETGRRSEVNWTLRLLNADSKLHVMEKAAAVAFNERKRGGRRMVTKAKPPNPFAGRWRITSMEQWDQDFVDEEEEGYFEFTEKGMGVFHYPVEMAGSSSVVQRQGKGDPYRQGSMDP
jgi:hypothetical protein